jgi:hypothetical protein
LPLVSKRQRLQLNQLQYNKLLQTVKVEKLWLTRHDTRSKEKCLFYATTTLRISDQAGEMTKTYTVKPLSFAAQMKAIHDAGYHSILPNQLYNYLAWRRSFTLKTYYDYL